MAYILIIRNLTEVDNLFKDFVFNPVITNKLLFHCKQLKKTRAIS